MENIFILIVAIWLGFLFWVAPVWIATGYAKKHNLSPVVWGMLAFFFSWIPVLIELVIGYSIPEQKNKGLPIN